MRVRSSAKAPRGISRAWAPDVPDQIIAAKAIHPDAPLISREGRITASSLATIR